MRVLAFTVAKKYSISLHTFFTSLWMWMEWVIGKAPISFFLDCTGLDLLKLLLSLLLLQALQLFLRTNAIMLWWRCGNGLHANTLALPSRNALTYAHTLPNILTSLTRELNLAVPILAFFVQVHFTYYRGDCVVGSVLQSLGSTCVVEMMLWDFGVVLFRSFGRKSTWCRSIECP